MLTEKSARVAAAHRLLRKSRRIETGEFLAEGAQAVSEAVAAAADDPDLVCELYLTEQAAHRHVELVRSAYAAGIEVTQVTDRAAAALSDAATPQGLVARCRVQWAELNTVLASSPSLLVVLVDVADPGNAGTVLRLADATGAAAVVYAGDAVDPFNPKAVRASTGSLFHLPVVRAPDVSALLDRLAGSGLSCLATAGSAVDDLDAAIDGGLLDLPTAWIFGSEAHGLAPTVASRADATVRIPIYGRAESLNLATAAAVCLYASARAQRRS